MPGPATRTITGPVASAAGALWTGAIQVTWPAAVSGDGFTIVAGSRMVQVVGGVLSIDLVPGTYAVRYAGGVERTWVVPAGSGSLTVAQVEQAG